MENFVLHDQQVMAGPRKELEVEVGPQKIIINVT